MAKRKVKTFDLDEELKVKLQKNNYNTVEDVLSKPSLQLMTALRLSAYETDKLITKLSAACLPTCYTAFEMLAMEKFKFIPVGNQSLDKLLQGGIKKGALTELAGPPGVGKTQMCFHLSLQCLKTKLDVNAVCYIDTEGAFMSERLSEMIEANQVFDNSIEEVLTKLHVFKPTDVVSLSEILNTLEMFCIENNVGLLIIDSIASLVRKEFSYETNIARSEVLASWAAQIKSLAEHLKVAVVVTNQVTTRSNSYNISSDAKDTKENEELMEYNEDSGASCYHVGPALGNTWTHFVNTRIILEFLDSNKRQFIIAKSPVSPFATKEFTIDHSGVIFSEKTCYTFDFVDPNSHHIKVNPGLKLL